MRLQYSVSIYWREGNCAINGVHISFRKVVLNGVNSLSYRGYAEQPSFLLLRTVSLIYEASMYIVDDNFRSYRRCRGLDGYLFRRLSLPANCANILF